MSEVLGLFGAAVQMPFAMLSSATQLFGVVVGSWFDGSPALATSVNEGTPKGTGSPTAEPPREDRTYLGGDDLKYVGHTLLFTKPDLEVVLESRSHQNLINYATNGESFQALRTADFFERVRLGLVARPALWIEANYPHGARGRFHWAIPREDLKYLTFEYGVRLRLPKSPTEYDKRSTRALECIARTLGRPRQGGPGPTTSGGQRPFD